MLPRRSRSILKGTLPPRARAPLDSPAHSQAHRRRSPARRIRREGKVDPKEEVDRAGTVECLHARFSALSRPPPHLLRRSSQQWFSSALSWAPLRQGLGRAWANAASVRMHVGRLVSFRPCWRGAEGRSKANLTPKICLKGAQRPSCSNVLIVQANLYLINQQLARLSARDWAG